VSAANGKSRKPPVTSEILDRQPPRNLEAEKAVLGSLLLDSKRYPEVVAVIKPSDFYDDANQKIFGHFAPIYESGAKIEMALLVHRLRSSGDYDRVGGAAYLGDVTRSAPTPTNVLHYAGIVRELANKRRTIDISTVMMRDAYNGKSTANIISDCRGELEQISASSNFVSFRRFTCKELSAAEFPLEYLIPNILVAGQHGVIGGRQKTLKTSIGIDLAISLATAGHFLGYFKVARGCQVAMMTGESGLATIRETADRIAKTANYRLDKISGLVFSDQLPQLSDPQHIDALKRFIDNDEIEVLLIDPAYLCIDTSGNEASLFHMGRILRPIGELCIERGVTLLLLHHLNKSGQADLFTPPELAHLSWAGFPEFARQWLLLGRREQYEPGSGVHRLWLNCGGSAGHSGCWAVDIDEGAYDPNTPRRWEVRVDRAETALRESLQRQQTVRTEANRQKSDARLAADRTAAVKYLTIHPEGAAMHTIRDNSGINSTKRCNLALSKLLEDGFIETVEVRGRNGKLSTHNRIRQNNPDLFGQPPEQVKL